jgi:hypothetical protein
MPLPGQGMQIGAHHRQRPGRFPLRSGGVPLFGSHYQTIQPFAPHQRMLSRALNGNAGLAGWNFTSSSR